MRISTILPTLNISAGGPPRSVTALYSGMGLHNPNTAIYMHAGQTTEPTYDVLLPKNIQRVFHPQSIIGILNGLEKSFDKTNSEIYHIQSIWDLCLTQTARYARLNNVPYIISPRGMLEPWALQQKRWKKRLALALYQRKDLRLATCIHATSEMEAENIRNLGFANPIAIVPNGIDTPLFSSAVRGINRPKKVLFLSRIHPKKGLENLIKVWSSLPKHINGDWSLEIVGNGEPAYIAKLQGLINEKGSGNIRIEPPAYGMEKIEKYREASLFVLPTFSENFGIVVAEALASKLPVITTTGAPWKDLKTHRCGWWIQPNSVSLNEALENALTTPIDQLHEMGERGRILVEEKYSIPVVAKKMYRVYQWMLGHSDKPEYVI